MTNKKPKGWGSPLSLTYTAVRTSHLPPAICMFLWDGVQMSGRYDAMRNYILTCKISPSENYRWTESCNFNKFCETASYWLEESYLYSDDNSVLPIPLFRYYSCEVYPAPDSQVPLCVAVQHRTNRRTDNSLIANKLTLTSLPRPMNLSREIHCRFQNRMK